MDGTQPSIDEDICSVTSSLSSKKSDSPDSSHVSIKSDWSMEPPPLLANKNKSSDSPQSSHVSMNSDWPMEPPSFLADKKKLADSLRSSHVSIKSDWPMEPPSLLADKKKSPDSPESSHECMKIDCSMEPSPILTNGNKSSAHRSNLLKRCQCLYEGTVMQGDPTLLNEIYTEVYITESESGEISNEHEVRQIETQSRRSTTEDTPIKCRDIFTPLPGQDKAIRTVLTKGVAGIGKTVSVQKFILDWAEEKENQDVQFIFPLPFREINLMKDKNFSLLSLLQTFFMREIHLDLIQNSSIIFIFDGLDECRLPFNFSSNETLRDMTKETSVDVLLTNLIVGNLLPSALIWITSRPAAADLVPSECVHRVTEVRGFNDPQKEEYFRKRINDQSLANTIISHLKSSRSLYIMCHIPVFCWISATVLEKMLSEAETTEIPKTLTQMYTNFLMAQINIKHQKDYEEKVPDEDMILKLGKVAFQQLMKGNLIFYEEDLRECGIDVAEASIYSGLCTQIFREEFGLYQRKVFSFVHLSIQEHLAALYAHITFSYNKINVFGQTTEQTNKAIITHLRIHHVSEDFESFFVKSFMEHELFELHQRAVNETLLSNNGHLDLFLRFLLGLSVESNQILLQRLMKQKKSCSDRNKETVEYIKMNIRAINSSEKTMNLFHCLNELGDDSLVEEIQQYLKSGKIKEAKLSSSQWSALVFVLLTTEKKLDEFWLNEYVGAENKADHVLQTLLPVVKESKTAKLINCGITDVGCADLASALGSNPEHLKELDLSNNNLRDCGVKSLLTELKNPDCKLEILRLRNCRLRIESCAALSSALISNPSHLRELDMSRNRLGDLGHELLTALLKSPHFKLKKLQIYKYPMTFSSSPSLYTRRRRRPQTLME